MWHRHPPTQACYHRYFHHYLTTETQSHQRRHQMLHQPLTTTPLQSRSLPYQLQYLRHLHRH